MIRPAEEKDLSQLLRLGIDFMEAAWAGVLEYETKDIHSTLTNLLRDDTGILSVAEVNGEIVGMAGALIYPLYFNTAHMTGQELFWWVKPEHRKSSVGIKLLDSIEAEAKAKGAITFTMIALDHMSYETLKNIYERRGYTASEHSFTRRL